MFKGAFTALVTPMRDGNVDLDALTRLVETQIEQGIHGLVPCGTTGESSTLSYQEHVKVVETTLKAAAGRVPVLAGAGSNSTREAIELARACKELGAKATLQITPYYNKPNQDGLYAHFVAIAEASGLPVVLYNVPGRTAIDLQADTVARLAEHELIVGIKEATADLHRAAQIRGLCGDGFALLSGDDFTLLPFLSLGGHGVISVGSNVVPGLYAKLVDAAAQGDWSTARELHYAQLPLCRALFADANPMPIKIALAQLDRIAREARSPMVLPSPQSELDTVVATAVAALKDWT